MTDVPGTGRWLRDGLDNVGTAFEVKQAAKYKDELTHVGFGYSNPTLGKTDIDLVTTRYALQCKAESYTGIPGILSETPTAAQLERITKARDSLLGQIEKTVAFAAQPQHAGQMTAAIIFHEPPPPRVMEWLGDLISSGRLVVLNP